MSARAMIRFGQPLALFDSDRRPSFWAGGARPVSLSGMEEKMKTRSQTHCRSAAVPVLAAAIALLVVATPTTAQPQPQGGGEEEIQQTVARVAYRSGPATYSRGDDPENWQDVAVNVPLTLGDRVYTGKDGRLELETGGTRIFIAPETQMTALDLRDDVRQLSVAVGTATFRVRRLADGEVFEVDTPNVSVTFRRPGKYRVDVDADGNTRFILFEGGALGVAAGGQIDLSQGDTMEVEGTDQPRYDLVAQPAQDRWDRWVEDRLRPRQEAVAAKYVSEEVVGAEDLDEDGSWEEIPEQGMAWTPRGVAAGWAPYTEGRWMWQDPWGWSWVGAERWGWAPYHYGSWTSWRNRWFWLPAARGERFVRYSPARVVFAGGPPGHGAMGGHVGWFPVGPREPFSPWWGHRVPVPVPPGFGFMNRGYMHAVRHDTFVGGGYVQRGFIHDAAVMRGLAAAPFIHGPLPFLPTQASIRMPFPGGSRGPMLRPPNAFLSRSVVTRLAPPLAPPGFSTKMGFIKENHGMPVDRRVSEKLSIDHFHGARPVADIRPAGGAGGKVDFAPKRDFGAAHKVQPVSVPQGQGRSLATHDKPVGIQSKDLQSYQRPVSERQGRPVTNTAGQGQTHGQVGGKPERLVKVETQGQQTTGHTGTTGQGFAKKDGTRTSGQGQTQTQTQTQTQGQRTSTYRLEKKTDQGTTGSSNQVQGQPVKRGNDTATGSRSDQRATGQGQQTHVTSRKTESNVSGQQGSTRTSGQSTTRSVERSTVKQQAAPQPVAKPPVQKPAPVVRQPPPAPPRQSAPQRQSAPPPKPPARTDKKVG